MDSPVRVIGMHRLPQRDATLEAVTRVSRTAPPTPTSRGGRVETTATPPSQIGVGASYPPRARSAGPAAGAPGGEFVAGDRGHVSVVGRGLGDRLGRQFASEPWISLNAPLIAMPNTPCPP